MLVITLPLCGMIADLAIRPVSACDDHIDKQDKFSKLCTHSMQSLLMGSDVFVLTPLAASALSAQYSITSVLLSLQRLVRTSYANGLSLCSLSGDFWRYLIARVDVHCPKADSTLVVTLALAFRSSCCMHARCKSSDLHWYCHWLYACLLARQDRVQRRVITASRPPSKLVQTCTVSATPISRLGYGRRLPCAC